ncbi:MAG: Mur ligase family protein [Bacilli bacterium]|jgi:dihydrofolate synthase/folylpolyglutamate synthase|nr:Mur ligase family protein [Bacilli bacterium]
MLKMIDEINTFFQTHIYQRYEKDSFLSFLKKVNFSFSLPVIHLTGTNGKGSTLRYLKNIYVKAGYQVASFTSPYFNEVNEMISINFVNISNEDLMNIFNEYYLDFIKFDLSSFEIQTFIALIYFLKKDVDLVLLEVGMGGELDATNIIHNELTIISSVSLEHTNYLGRSVSEIAHAKAGLIKFKSRVLISKLEDSARLAINEESKRQKATLYEVDEYHHLEIKDNEITFDYLPYKDLKIKTLAKYQVKNASLAIEATNILNDLFPINKEHIYEGLLINPLINHFEMINPHLLLDGAHNPEAITYLLEALEEVNHLPIHFLFATFKDKNHTLMLNLLAKDASSITLTSFNHKRARSRDEYFLFLEEYQFIDNYLDALNYLLETYKDDLIVVTGSLAFATLVRKSLK